MSQLVCIARRARQAEGARIADGVHAGLVSRAREERAREVALGELELGRGVTARWRAAISSKRSGWHGTRRSVGSSGG
jgi:hypothetical protein